MLVPRLGPLTIRRLLDHFPDPQAILAASPGQLAKVRGVGTQIAASIHRWQETANPHAEQQHMRENGSYFVSQCDEDYPPLLREIYDPPAGLFVRGRLEARDRLAIAVVGSRHTTHYGREAARQLSFQLARSGVTVISGLARGIDTCAHEGALQAGGRTIAVLGSGHDRLYPPENTKLADRIADNGAVLSEFPSRTAPDKTTFPLRNRIVSGMSRGILVVECPERSGSLITANMAADQNRTVYAVPGPITSGSSAGCHQLIRDGARLVTSAEDILEDLQCLIPREQQLSDAKLIAEHSRKPPLEGDAAAIYAALDVTETPFDTLIERTGLTAANLSRTLSRLEIQGHVKQLPGQFFIRLHS